MQDCAAWNLTSICEKNDSIAQFTKKLCCSKDATEKPLPASSSAQYRVPWPVTEWNLLKSSYSKPILLRENACSKKIVGEIYWRVRNEEGRIMLFTFVESFQPRWMFALIQDWKRLQNVIYLSLQTRRIRSRDLQNAKMLTTPRIPKPSPIQVLTGPTVA